MKIVRTTINNVCFMEHDGMLFTVNLTKLLAVNSDLDEVATYRDHLGNLQHVLRKSLYGGHIEKALTEISSEKTQEEHIAAAMAHRACCGSEHDPQNGKLHGYCMVCGVEWPCETARRYL